MNITKKDLIFLLLIVLSFYLNRRPVEKMVNISKDGAGNYVIPGNLLVHGAAQINTKKTSKNDMFLIHHSDGGYFYFNSAPGFGTYNIPKKNLIIHAKHIYTQGIEAQNVHSHNSIFSAGKVHAAKGFEGTLNQLSSSTEAIRNLSDLANQLTKNGKLIVPGGLEIRGNLSVGGKARIGSSCEVNTLRKAKNNMFIVHHPEGGFFYFNNAPGLGTYGIPNKNLIISAQDVNTGTVRCGNVTATNSIYSSNTIQAEKGLYGGFLKVTGSAEINTGRKAKNDMFIVHHPEGGFFYFNNAPGFGTYNIPNKNLIIHANDVNVRGQPVLKNGDNTLLYNRSHNAYIENCGHQKSPCNGGYALRSHTDKSRVSGGSGIFNLQKI